MNKLIKTIIAGTIILTSGITINEANAKTSKSRPNYYNSAVVKKVKAGTYVFDGFKLGGRLETYLNDPDYEEGFEGQVRLYNSRVDIAIADRYDGLENPKITRVFDNKADDKNKFEMKKMRRIYGKPIQTFRSVDVYADVYKNVVFVYDREHDSNRAYLRCVLFYKMNSKDNVMFKKYIRSTFNNNFSFSYPISTEDFKYLK
ncbi:hypothetical protein BHU61_00440 [Macrococcus epidermidis]|uniref:Uncharacterized protein n=1 Tax=Macrococcus epidermidis TaxID=1902580 RepID=A0A327ZUX8_9STAP|nr:hypothetical protein [Macrococcus epidermidis]RAK45947.1 hypothetical protein BHU61_00440 [Macrococcus epidermidis]